MSLIPYQNGNYQFKQDEIIFTEGYITQSVNILLQGKVDVYISPYEKCVGMAEEDVLRDSHRIFSIDKNIFIGANDLFLSKKYSFSYRASVESKIYVFIAQSLEHLKTLINSQKDYAAHIVTSITNLVNQSYQALNKLEKLVKNIEMLEENLIIFFWVLKEKLGFSYTPANSLFRIELDKLQKMTEKNFIFPSTFEAAFFEKDYSQIFEDEHTLAVEIDISKIGYYKLIQDLQTETRKNFFGENFYLTSYQCRDVSKLLGEIQFRLKEEFIKVKEYLNRFYSEDGECIFKEYIKIASDFSIHTSGSNTIFKVIDYMLLKFRETILFYEGEYNYKTGIDYKKLTNICEQLKSDAADPAKKGLQCKQDSCEIGEACIPEELIDSARKILEYSEIPKDRADLFWTNLMAFRNLKDRFSSDEEAKLIRDSVSIVFFEIYKAVFKKVILKKSTCRLYHMFLTYAYMDEMLLCKEHVIALYNLFDSTNVSGFCPVYNTMDWLTKIYSMEKDPSVNEFGHDYFDVFREMKKRGEVTEKEKVKFDNDTEARLSYEIDNMFRINQRLCHGQISTYFPILHGEMITKDITKSLVTPEIIAASIKKLLEADFSAFHRELSFNNYEKGIDKEYSLKEPRNMTP